MYSKECVHIGCNNFLWFSNPTSKKTMPLILVGVTADTNNWAVWSFNRRKRCNYVPTVTHNPLPSNSGHFLYDTFKQLLWTRVGSWLPTHTRLQFSIYEISQLLKTVFPRAGFMNIAIKGLKKRHLSMQPNRDPLLSICNKINRSPCCC